MQRLRTLRTLQIQVWVFKGHLYALSSSLPVSLCLMLESISEHFVKEAVSFSFRTSFLFNENEYFPLVIYAVKSCFAVVVFALQQCGSSDGNVCWLVHYMDSDLNLVKCVVDWHSIC